ncbi:MAG: hypothetical protein ACI310_06815 [Bacilli bacterium]
MKKIVNNPKLLVIISIILLVISFVYTLNIHLVIGSLLDFTTSGCLVMLLYFILIISKKHINLTAMNTIVFINFVVVLLIRCTYIIKLFTSANYIILSLILSNYIPLFIVVAIYLGIIFYSKNKSIIKPNLISIICLLVYIVCLIGSIINVSTYGITKFEVAIRCIIQTLYYIPVILYFRLYALNKLEKMEVKNER